MALALRQSSLDGRTLAHKATKVAAREAKDGASETPSLQAERQSHPLDDSLPGEPMMRSTSTECRRCYRAADWCYCHFTQPRDGEEAHVPSVSDESILPTEGSTSRTCAICDSIICVPDDASQELDVSEPIITRESGVEENLLITCSTSSGDYPLATFSMPSFLEPLELSTSGFPVESDPMWNFPTPGNTLPHLDSGSRWAAGSPRVQDCHGDAAECLLGIGAHMSHTIPDFLEEGTKSTVHILDIN